VILRKDLSAGVVLCILTVRLPPGESEATMLVLSRKVDQTIVIQGNITIKILEINGDRVKVGIDAPRNVVILRQELTEETRNASPAGALSLDAHSLVPMAAEQSVDESG